MSPRALASLLGLVLVAVAFLTLRGEDPYMVRVQLENANGLREGSRVEIGGLAAGKVAKLDVDARDRVVANLELDSAARIGAGASVAIQAKNLLGEKSLQLRVGDLTKPQPSGSIIAPTRVENSVDLDKVLDVLEPTTRARLGILINEAGGAVAGRRQDLGEILRQLPSTFAAATNVVDQLVNDNRTLGQLIDRSDRFVARFAAERRQIGAFVDTAGQTAATVSARRKELSHTLQATPRTLDELQTLLGELERTTVPLGPAARSIADTAPSLTATLTAVRPFQRAAAPALDEAVRAAPQLTRLGRQAAPVLRRARPTVDAVATLATAAVPVTKTADATIDELLAILQGWSRAIQGRDGLSHMFRAKVLVNSDSLRTLLAVPGVSKKNKKTRKPASSGTPQREIAPAVPKAPKLPSLPKLPGLPKIPGLPDLNPAIDAARSDTEALLDYLLAP